MKKILIAIVLFSLSGCKSRPARPTLGGSQGIGVEQLDGTTAEAEASALKIVENRSNLRIHSYSTLIHKLKAVTGFKDDNASIQLAARLSQSLGAYNHSAGILPESKWTQDRMDAWFQVIDSVCRDPGILANIQTPEGAIMFIEATYGRSATPEEKEVVSLLAAKTFPPERKARIICSATLMSGEFVSL